MSSAAPNPMTPNDLEGFAADDLVAAFACFRRSAEAIVSDRSELRAALPADADLRRVCKAALALAPDLSQAAALEFFERNFLAERIVGEGGADAFLTGYYEPVVPGSLRRTPEFDAPLLSRPADLKTFAADEPRSSALEGFAAARVGANGALAVYPDRAAIEAAALDGAFRPVAWVRDWVEAFFIHVQGSARVRLEDGSLLRVTYAGRNGHPYTSVGKVLVDSGAMVLATMTLDSMKAWFRDNGLEAGQAGRAALQRNASFIFFEAEPARSDEGPIGGAGLPLTRLRSIAVDRTLWRYGLPFWIDADLPWESETPSRFRRLMVAQDTGSAIVGPARADLFFGSGDAAGRLAGGIRHRVAFTVLRPKPAPGTEP